MMSILDDGVIDTFEARKGFPFLSYASDHWTDHAKVGEQEDETFDMIDRFFKHPTAYDSWINRLALGWSEPVARRNWTPPALHVCIYFHLTQSALTYIKRCTIPWPQHVDREFRGHPMPQLKCQFHWESQGQALVKSPLYLSAQIGEEDVAGALLDKCVPETDEGGDEGTPLNIACVMGQEALVDLFLARNGVQGATYSDYIKNAVKVTADKCLRRWNWERDSSDEPRNRILRRLLGICANFGDNDPCLDSCLLGAFFLADCNLVRTIIRNGAKLDEVAKNILYLSKWEEPLYLMVEVLTEEEKSSFFHTVQTLAQNGHYQEPGFELLPRHHDRPLVYYALVLGATPLINLSAGEHKRSEARLDWEHFHKKMGFRHASRLDPKRLEVLDGPCKTPLHFRAQMGETEKAALLLYGGANVAAVDSEGQAPIHYAAIYNHLNTFTLLVRYGADLGLKDRHGRTAYMSARCSEPILNWIKEEHHSYAIDEIPVPASDEWIYAEILPLAVDEYPVYGWDEWTDGDRHVIGADDEMRVTEWDEVFPVLSDHSSD